MVFSWRRGALTLLAGLAACARSSSPPSSAPTLGMRPGATGGDTAPTAGALPPVPQVRGPLSIRVVYPPPDALVSAKDSSFLLGSVGTGDATLTINSYPVKVWPNGAWLAWIPLPPDSLMRFHIVARAAADSAALDYDVRRAGWAPPRAPGLWLDSASLSPRGRVWWPADEYITLSARASEGATLRMLLPDSTVVPLVPQSRLEEIPEAVRAFDRDTANLTMNIRRDRYVGVIRGRALGPSPGPVLPNPLAMPVAAGLLPPPAEWPVVEAIVGTDTVRARWPLQVAVLDSLPVIIETEDSSRTDGITTGRAVPNGTYYWFFPDGTRAAVSGRMNEYLRVRLSPESDAWISAAESATQFCTVCFSARGPPNASRAFAYRHISSNARCICPSQRITWWIRPGPSRFWASRNASPSPPSVFATGTRTPSNRTSQWVAHPRPACPMTGTARTTSTPSVSAGTRIIVPRR